MPLSRSERPRWTVPWRQGELLSLPPRGGTRFYSRLSLLRKDVRKMPLSRERKATMDPMNFEHGCSTLIINLSLNMLPFACNGEATSPVPSLE
jgi:hypothetical protein